jgi:hypothetical protein
MSFKTFVDTTDLDQWADRREAQGDFPRLLRRLILATGRQLTRISFPAGEDIQLGGWDGQVEADESDVFVPKGTSVWEMGVNENPKKKADKDYQKRCKNPLGLSTRKTTFVFVTPRRWGGKDAWLRARKRERKWKDVRAYDAGDLEAWLEHAPAVHLWLSILLKKHPEGARDLQGFWEDWSTTTQPAIPAALVLAGRREVEGKIQEWLRSPSVSLVLRAESRDEALAVFMAVLQSLSLDEREKIFSRSLLVDRLTEWYQLSDFTRPLLLVSKFGLSDGEATTRAVRNGHQVVIPLGVDEGTSPSDLEIKRLSRKEAEKALTEIGIPRERASQLALLARKSLMSFRRALARYHSIQQPVWAQPEEARLLIPLMFAGVWDGSSEGDRQVISNLTKKNYQEVEKFLIRWANASDPPVRSVGRAWVIVSKEDSWSLLSRHLSRDDLAQFKDVVLTVLGIPDPRFELPVEDQWMAQVKGYKLNESSLLRKSLAESLALIGSRGNRVTGPLAHPPGDYVRVIVRELLALANSNWKLWASLSSLLRLLAEAAPDEFLEAVEQGIQKGQIQQMFFDEKSKSSLVSSPHHGLLWACETIAWNPDYLARTVLVLCQLFDLDSEHRAFRSLHGIFRIWLPQSRASVDQRLVVLKLLRIRFPEISWLLMRALLPGPHEIAMNAARPRWRDWAPDTIGVSRKDYTQCLLAAMDCLLFDAGSNGDRWIALLNCFDRFPKEYREKLLQRLEAMGLNEFSSTDRVSIWGELRKFLSSHRSSSKSKNLSKKELTRFERLYEHFEPPEFIDRYGWLFSDNPILLEGRNRDWNKHQELICKKQEDAVEQIYKKDKLTGLLLMAEKVQNPEIFGMILGRSSLVKSKENMILGEHLASQKDVYYGFARGFARGRVQSRGRVWAEKKILGLARDWLSSQRGELLVVLPYDKKTWDLAEHAGPEVERYYWQKVYAHASLKELQEIEKVVNKLILYDRPARAVELLGIYSYHNTLPPVLVAEAIEAMLQNPRQEGDAQISSFSYNLGELLDLLVNAPEVKEDRVAKLEWALLYVLSSYERKPQILHRELSRNPDFFFHVLSLIYSFKSKSEVEPEEESKVQAQLAYALLSSWRTLPGTDKSGLIDAVSLKNWTRRARNLYRASDLEDRGDYVLGEVLSGSPVDKDGIWPHTAVRDIIEELKSECLEDGFRIGLYNGRGVISRELFEGGKQERTLAERYYEYAIKIRDLWPHTSTVLHKIAKSYSFEAGQRDQHAELEQDLDE